MASRFWVGGAGTWDTTDTTHWASVTNGAGGASVPTSTDTVTFDANSGSGTITVNGNHSITSFTCSFGAGLTFDWSVNNNNLTCAGLFTFNSASANTLKLGNGTFTFTTGGWNAGSAALTFVPGNATIVISNLTGTSNSNFVTGAANIPTNVVLGPSTGIPGISLGSSAGASNLTLIGPVRLYLSASVVLTASTLTLVNTKGRPIELRGIGSVIAALSMASGAIEFNWSSIRNMNFTGGATFSAKNSFDLGLNTGITISPPKSGLILGG